jgi:hypothetical protein
MRSSAATKAAVTPRSLAIGLVASQSRARILGRGMTGTS